MPLARVTLSSYNKKQIPDVNPYCGLGLLVSDFPWLKSSLYFTPTLDTGNTKTHLGAHNFVAEACDG